MSAEAYVIFTKKGTGEDIKKLKSELEDSNLKVDDKSYSFLNGLRVILSEDVVGKWKEHPLVGKLDKESEGKREIAHGEEEGGSKKQHHLY